MNDPTIICPTCKTEIKLTESLAAPLLESTRRQYEKQIAENNAEVGKREAAIKAQEAALAKAAEALAMSKSPQGSRPNAPRLPPRRRKKREFY